MELKKMISLLIAGLSFAGAIGIISAQATTSLQSDSNRSWTYGKNTSTTAISNLLDNVATHDSDVLNSTTGAFSGTITAPVRTVSYAKVTASSSNTMVYQCSVAYWNDVVTTK